MRIVAIVLACSLAAACSGESTQQRGNPIAVDDSAAIARVLSSLRPGIAVKGEAPPQFSLAERMAKYHVPGVSIAVVDGGRIVWARGYGVREAGSTDSVTPTTLFQAASISKPVAATGMLRLVDEGILSLDAPVNDYLESWRLPDNRFTASEKVTLRRIASHNAGLTVHGFPGYADTASVPTVQQLLDGAKPANTAAVRVDTTPGAIVRYSGGGTTVEQLVMTEVTGEEFAPLMRRLVLDPIGMTRSGYDQPLDSARRGEAASGHDGAGTVVPGKWHTYPERAAAGLWTTPSDLLTWAMEIAAARAGTSTKVLTQKTASEMLTVQKATFGIGPMLDGAGDSLSFGHGGANEGFRAHVLYFPGTNQGAAVMTNADNGGTLLQEVLYAIAAEYGWPNHAPRDIAPIAVDSSALNAYVGTYTLTSPMNARLRVTREGGKLYIEEPQFIPRTELLFLAPDSVIARESGMSASFGRRSSGAVDRLQLGGMTLRKAR